MSIPENRDFPWIPALVLIFIALKLTGHLTWSWWWVLSPVWISLLVSLAFFAVVWLFDQIADWRDQ